MFETPLTVVGTIVTDPIRRTVAGQELIKFRVASNSRRREADGTWANGNSLYITVNCWARLVTGVGAALSKGSPVIVVGSIHTSEYDDRDGIRRAALEMRATAVGPDLSRCVARIDKLVHTGPRDATEPDEAPEGDAEPDGTEGDAAGELTDDGEDISPAEEFAVSSKGLSLSV